MAGFRVDEAGARISCEVTRESDSPTEWRIQVRSSGAPGVGMVLPCTLAEHFVGFGEQFRQLDKRGRLIDGWVGTSVNGGAQLSPGLDGGLKLWPVFYSSAGYAVLLETSRRFQVDLAVTDPHQVVLCCPGEVLSIRVFGGPPKAACQLLTAFTGRPPLAPPWVYGVWKATISGAEAVLRDAERLRTERIPCSALWFYDFYDPATNSGTGPAATGTYPRGEYPDLPGLVAELHRRDFRVLGYVTPYVYRGTPAFDEAVGAGAVITEADGTPAMLDHLHPLAGDDMKIFESQGLHSMFGGAAQLDLTGQPGRRFWQAKLREILLGLGFDGWMEDFGEGVPAGAVLCDGSTASEGHNRFPAQYHGAAADELARSKPDGAFFARSGWLGSQASVPVFWPGDQTRDWSAASGLAQVPAAGISLGLMGVAAWGPDIGGCMGFTGLEEGFGGGSEDKELWIRWCQLGAVAPVMRDHPGFHTGTPVDTWTDEETIATWRSCAEFHIRLFPYLYSCATEAARTGLPVLRGLLLEYPDDEECWVISNQFLLGADLLCAPVLWAGCRSRDVYFPAGSWTDICTERSFTGPGWATVDTPLDRLPVFQRCGSVVARLPAGVLHLNADAYRTGSFDLSLAVSPGWHGAAKLFDDTLITFAGNTISIESERARDYRITSPAGHLLATAGGRGRLHLDLPVRNES